MAVVGVDLDNTLVSYDRLFPALAGDRQLVPAEAAINKQSIRDHLRSCGRESEFTELQGEVYGSQMHLAVPYPGAFECLVKLQREGKQVCVISHRSRFPYAGPAYDLHAAARSWLEQQGLHDPSRVGLPREQVFLELTLPEKVARISSQGCTHFIDDLTELLGHPEFPAGVVRILFDPHQSHPDAAHYLRATSWEQIDAILAGRSSP